MCELIKILNFHLQKIILFTADSRRDNVQSHAEFDYYAGSPRRVVCLIIFSFINNFLGTIRILRTCALKSNFINFCLFILAHNSNKRRNKSTQIFCVNCNQTVSLTRDSDLHANLRWTSCLSAVCKLTTIFFILVYIRKKRRNEKKLLCSADICTRSPAFRLSLKREPAVINSKTSAVLFINRYAFSFLLFCASTPRFVNISRFAIRVIIRRKSIGSGNYTRNSSN